MTCSTEVTALERSFPHHVAATVVVETTTKWCLKAARGSVKLIPPALAILALPPDAIVRADAAADAVLALASLAVILAGARAPAVLADAPLAVMLADAGAPAILADAPVAVMLADAGAPAILADAPVAVMLADARTPAVLVPVPASVMLALAGPPLRRAQPLPLPLPLSTCSCLALPLPRVPAPARRPRPPRRPPRGTLGTCPTACRARTVGPALHLLRLISLCHRDCPARKPRSKGRLCLAAAPRRVRSTTTCSCS